MAAKAKTKVDDGYVMATSQEALTEDTLTKLQVLLTAGAHDAMTRASESTGDSLTDTINRALHVYATIVMVPEGTTISFDKSADGTVRKVTVIQ